MAAADKLKVFAQPQRLMILSCLLRSERNVGEIAEATGIGQPALSQQLAELRRAELVRTRRESKQVWYALANDGVVLCVRNMEAIFGGSGIPDELPLADAPPEPEATSEGVARFARIL
jgi:DNA-binding transcriptional ArsR family regulator